MEYFLESAIPVRFHDTEPREFEAFIGFLFEKNGYKLVHPEYRSDFGVDLIVDLKGERTAILVRRFSESHRIDTSEVKQILGAQTYYGFSGCMIITTSSFTRKAREMADPEVILWDWHRLKKVIFDTFLKSQDYNSFYGRLSGDSLVRIPALGLKISSIGTDKCEGTAENRIVMYLELTNRTKDPVQISIDKPLYLTHDHKQFAATEWTKDGFVEGVIYEKATVDVGFYFSHRHYRSFNPIDKIVMTVHVVENGESVVLEQGLDQVKKTLGHQVQLFLKKIFKQT